MSDGIEIEDIADGVRQLRLARPERLNALGLDMCLAIPPAVDAEERRGTRVLLVRGTGRGFCAGADLKARSAMGPDDRFAHNRAIDAAIGRLAATPMATIAVINGLALGGGCELALACDLRLAAAGVSIGLTETRIGAIPGAGGTQRLPRIIGQARALELILTGEPISAERAAAIGLVNETVVEAVLDARALALASLIASRSPLGIAEIKALVRAAGEMTMEDGLRREAEAVQRVLASADYAEGLAAFAEKRRPKFTGR